MALNHYTILPADQTDHFAAIAELLTAEETEPSSASTLAEWYNQQLQDGIRFAIIVSPEGMLLGFNGIFCANLNLDRYFGIYLIVKPGFRKLGLGSLLYDHLLVQADELGARSLRARVRDTSAESIRFATRRGFIEKKHSIEMMFDLNSWDDCRYAAILQALQVQGFHFTNMAELGDTPTNRRKLFTLNNSAAATDPGSDGIPPWSSFEEFNRDVCSSSWYRPDGQIVAIDSATGDWAAMSAITVFEGADHAYNLFTGTNVRYRGRKLAQAVKALALRKARTFGVNKVRTSHNSENAAMIAIDTRLGYVRTPGTLVMEKELGHA